MKKSFRGVKRIDTCVPYCHCNPQVEPMGFPVPLVEQTDTDPHALGYPSETFSLKTTFDVHLDQILSLRTRRERCMCHRSTLMCHACIPSWPLTSTLTALHL